MAMIRNILLVILAVRSAIVLTQYGSAQHSRETLPDNIVQRLASVIADQRQLMEKTMEQDAAIERLRGTYRALQTEFDCHLPPCQSCTCIYIKTASITNTERLRQKVYS